MNDTLEKLFSPDDINEHYAVLLALAGKRKRIAECGIGYGRLTDLLLTTYPEVLCSCDHRYDDIVQSAVTRIKSSAEKRGTAFSFERCDSRVFDIKDVDLLIIDSYGAYLQVLPELINLSPYVSEYICIHNTSIYGERTEWGGSPSLRQGIEDFLARNSKWTKIYEYGHNNGMTILKRVDPGN